MVLGGGKGQDNPPGWGQCWSTWTEGAVPGPGLRIEPRMGICARIWDREGIFDKFECEWNIQNKEPLGSNVYRMIRNISKYDGQINKLKV